MYQTQMQCKHVATLPRTIISLTTMTNSPHRNNYKQTQTNKSHPKHCEKTQKLLNKYPRDFAPSRSKSET